LKTFTDGKNAENGAAHGLPEAGARVPIALSGEAASIYIDPQAKDYAGLKRVADSLAEDIKLITGIVPAVVTEAGALRGTVIIAGSVGNNSLISQLVQKGELSVSEIEDKWECYKIQVVERPLPEVDKAIVIAGSDKRGTIYGIYHISELIGVSPWVYWGDALPDRRKELLFSESLLSITSREPTVKYRGFFLNDEWPSLGTWVTGTFGDFNEEFYDKVFQLILRLKGNFMWPAMWSAVFSENGKSSSIANARLAHEYGIVMGTSHHEPMFRAGEEWKKINRQYGNNEAWDFSTNEEAITRFWEDGLMRNKEFESLITIGMRGEQDSALKGSEKENIELLKKIIKTQKDLLKKHGLERAPQVLTIYKEVEKYWYGSDTAEGLRYWDVLDDVTIMLADDNFANVRTLPAENERSRKAGWGMYYHFDYHGGPRSYEWINTTPLEKVWEQMSMTFDYGVRDIWIVNIGDLKPMEFPVSYFMDLAYDFDTWGKNGRNKTREYTEMWVSKQFGKGLEDRVLNGMADVLSDYTKMNGSRKPEVTYQDTYNPINYNEAKRVLEKAADLESRAGQYERLIPETSGDAYYQLVYYPAAASANIVKMQIYAGLNNLYYKRGSVLANHFADLVQECMDMDVNMQRHYNEVMSGGKWKGIMSSPHIGYTQWSPEGWEYPAVKRITPKKSSHMIVDVEGSEPGYTSDCCELPVFTNLLKERHSFTISNGGSGEFEYRVEADADWIIADKRAGRVECGETIAVNVDWGRVSASTQGLITVSGAGKSVQVRVVAEVTDTDGLQPMTFVETQGVVSIEAEHTADRGEKSGVEWKVIENYGRTLSAVKMFPTTVSFESPEAAPYLEYRIKVNRDSEYILTTYTAPTNNLYEKSRLRYAVAFDGEAATVADALPPEFIAGSYENDIWCDAVLDNIHITSTTHKLAGGIHTLRLYGLDAGLVLQKLVLSREELPKSYFGPCESFYVGRTL